MSLAYPCEIIRLDGADDLQLYAGARQHRGGDGKEGFHGDALGRPVEAADHDRPAGNAGADGARGHTPAAVARRQEGHRRAVGAGGKGPAIVRRVGGHQVGFCHEAPFQSRDLESIDLLGDADGLLGAGIIDADGIDVALARRHFDAVTQRGG